MQYLGKVEHERFVGSLSVAPVADLDGEKLLWVLFGDIAADGKVVQRDAFIATDSGTTDILGPIESVKALFDATGIQSVLHPDTTEGAPTTLEGYYPCAHSPEIGFGFPSITNSSSVAKNSNSSVSPFSTIFNILPSQLAQNSTDGNCTVAIHGTDEFDNMGPNFWLVGQGEWVCIGLNN